MVGDLKEQGFEAVVSLDPCIAVHPGHAPHDEGLAKGYFVTRPDGVIPIYVKAGASLTTQKVFRHARETPSGPLEIMAYLAPEMSGDLYLDDGESFRYREGESCRIHLHGTPEELVLDAPQGSCTPWFREPPIRVVGGKMRDSNEPGSLGGSPGGVAWKAEGVRVSIP